MTTVVLSPPKKAPGAEVRGTSVVREREQRKRDQSQGPERGTASPERGTWMARKGPSF